MDTFCSSRNYEFFFVLDSKKVPDEINEYSLAAENNDSSQLTVFYIVLCLGCSFITVLVICFLAFIVTNKKDNRRNRTP